MSQLFKGSHQHLLVVTLNTLGHAYQIAQRVFLAEPLLNLLEVVPSRTGATVLVLGSSDAIGELAGTILENEGMTSAIIESHVEAIVRAFYSLDAHPMRKHLVFFEAPLAAELFQFGERAMHLGEFSILDLKVPRGGQMVGLIALTTDNGTLIQQLPPAEGSGRSLTVIRDRADGFSRYFPVT